MPLIAYHGPCDEAIMPIVRRSTIGVQEIVAIRADQCQSMARP